MSGTLRKAGFDRISAFDATLEGRAGTAGAEDPCELDGV